jgi:hypothetical protein
VTSLVYLRLTPRSPHLTHSHLSSSTNQPLSFSFSFTLLLLLFPFSSSRSAISTLHSTLEILIGRTKCVLHAFSFLYFSSQFLSYSSVALYRPRFDPPTQITPLGGTSGPKQQRLAPSFRGLMMTMIMTMTIMTAQKSRQSPFGTPCTITRLFHYSHQMRPSV